jgi:hypothetical protein
MENTERPPVTPNPIIVGDIVVEQPKPKPKPPVKS